MAERLIPYASSPLAKLRKACGLTQAQAATRMGMRFKQNLCPVETGSVMASASLMARMVEVYGVSKRKVLKAATQTFERGITMRRHRLRQAKLLT